MNILITNDDGYTATGIQVLTDLMCQLGDVTVVAPDGPRSAQSNAITVITPLRIKKREERKGLRIYSCSGTPTDCVKIAMSEFFANQKPDLVVSGINHGSNASINIIYSGTMGAVLEACQQGIPAIGFSLCDYSGSADFSHFAPYILEITKKLVDVQVPYGTCFNVNAPAGPVKGVRKARQCRASWAESFVQKTDPMGKPYYWITGQFKNHEPQATDTDEAALEQGFISVVPIKIDMTDYGFMDKFEV